ncbi:inositol monophosphatase [bacterium]|nr:inositol monophosphatase [bacterium]
MSDFSPTDFIAPLEELARGAGAVLMRHFRRLGTYEKKGAIDLQTVADRESEAWLTAQIRARFPEHSILAEEDGSIINPGSDFLWIIDPLDGTTNYAHGLRFFGVSIGLTHRGAPFAGAILAPALDELYLAALGAGATRNGERIHVSMTTELIDALVVTGYPYNRAQYAEVLSDVHKAALIETRGVLRLGAASLDFANVAAGHLEAFWEWGLKPWDMAAGALLVSEAGGKLGGLVPGEPFDLFSGRMIASNGLIHGQLIDCLGRGGIGRLPNPA